MWTSTAWPALDPKDDDVRFTAADGKEYVFRKQLIAGLDRNVKELTDGGAIVYLILLSYESGDPARNAAMLHAKYDKTAKTNRMGAFNTAVGEDGRSWFAAVNEFIAQRYSGADSSHGRVWGYIVGNEVNSHWWWYNMGRVPLEEIAAEYERAVRIVHTAVRRASQNARVYLSFEHHWGIRYPPGKAGSIGARARPARYVCADRPRAWGFRLACGPSPVSGESRRPAHVARQELPTTADDSPRVTFKNLEVLAAHLSRPELLWNGRAQARDPLRARLPLPRRSPGR
jgi:hypothetical protein